MFDNTIHTTSLTKTERLLPWRNNNEHQRKPPHILSPVVASTAPNLELRDDTGTRHLRLLHELGKSPQPQQQPPIESESFVTRTVRLMTELQRVSPANPMYNQLDEINKGVVSKKKTRKPKDVHNNNNLSDQSATSMTTHAVQVDALCRNVTAHIKSQLRSLSETYPNINGKHSHHQTRKRGGPGRSAVAGCVAVVMTEEDRYHKEKYGIYRQVMHLIADAFPSLQELLHMIDAEQQQYTSYLVDQLQLHQEVIMGLRADMSKQRQAHEVVVSEFREKIQSLEDHISTQQNQITKLNQEIESERLKYVVQIDSKNKITHLERLLEQSRQAIIQKQFENDRLRVENAHLHVETFSDLVHDLQQQVTLWHTSSEKLTEEVDVLKTNLGNVVTDFRALVQVVLKYTDDSQIQMSPSTQSLVFS